MPVLHIAGRAGGFMLFDGVTLTSRREAGEAPTAQGSVQQDNPLPSPSSSSSSCPALGFRWHPGHASALETELLVLQCPCYPG